MEYDSIVVGCGLSGAVMARYLAEEKHEKVLILERRDHIGGNMYDYVNEHGILVHKYGPHTFHTKKKELYDYMCRFEEWVPYKLTCGAVINGKYTPTPFNFQTIDDFFSEDEAGKIKEALLEEYPNQEFVTILELLSHERKEIQSYAQFLFDNDYKLYTAKQWGISSDEIDPSVLKRVPVRLNYEIGYFDDEYQVMPKHSYAHFFNNLLNHSNIEVQLNCNALDRIQLVANAPILFDGSIFDGKVIYTGALDELFDYKYGILPYRSLRFEWKNENIRSFQKAPVVAYPQEKDFTRITEYTKLPVQEVGNFTTYAVEYSIPVEMNQKVEPYYPVITEQSRECYERYRRDAQKYGNLHLIGRLADFKYYNMDQVLEGVLEYNM